MKPSFVAKVNGLIERIMNPVAIPMHRKLGITANMITLSQIFIQPFILYYLYSFNFELVLALVGVTLMIDTLDGPYARITGTTSAKGHIYDRLMDILGITVFLIGLTFHDPSLLAFTSVLMVLTLSMYFIQSKIKKGTEIFVGARPLGLIGLYFNYTWIALIISTVLSISAIILKVVKK